MVGRLLPTLALFLAFIAGLLHGVAATYAEQSFAECQKMCAADNECCNIDIVQGSYSRLSCLQACTMVRGGVSEDDCNAECAKVQCDRTVNGVTYHHCNPPGCSDVPAHKDSVIGNGRKYQPTPYECAAQYGTDDNSCKKGCMNGARDYAVWKQWADDYPHTYDFIINVAQAGQFGPHIFYVKLDGLLPSQDQFTWHIPHSTACDDSMSGGNCSTGEIGMASADPLKYSAWNWDAGAGGVSEGLKIFSVASATMIHSIEISCLYPSYTPGWLIKENGVEVYRETANRGDSQTPSPATYTHTIRSASPPTLRQAPYCDGQGAATRLGFEYECPDRAVDPRVNDENNPADSCEAIQRIYPPAPSAPYYFYNTVRKCHSGEWTRVENATLVHSVDNPAGVRYHVSWGGGEDLNPNPNPNPNDVTYESLTNGRSGFDGEPMWHGAWLQASFDEDVAVNEVWIASGADESFGHCGDRSTDSYELWSSSAPNCSAANETLESFGFRNDTTFDAPEHDASKPPQRRAFGRTINARCLRIYPVGGTNETKAWGCLGEFRAEYSEPNPKSCACESGACVWGEAIDRDARAGGPKSRGPTGRYVRVVTNRNDQFSPPVKALALDGHFIAWNLESLERFDESGMPEDIQLAVRATASSVARTRQPTEACYAYDAADVDPAERSDACEVNVWNLNSLNDPYVETDNKAEVNDYETAEWIELDLGEDQVVDGLHIKFRDEDWLANTATSYQVPAANTDNTYYPYFEILNSTRDRVYVSKQRCTLKNCLLDLTTGPDAYPRDAGNDRLSDTQFDPKNWFSYGGNNWAVSKSSVCWSRNDGLAKCREQCACIFDTSCDMNTVTYYCNDWCVNSAFCTTTDKSYYESSQNPFYGGPFTRNTCLDYCTLAYEYNGDRVAASAGLSTETPTREEAFEWDRVVEHHRDWRSSIEPQPYVALNPSALLAESIAAGNAVKSEESPLGATVTPVECSDEGFGVDKNDRSFAAGARRKECWCRTRGLEVTKKWCAMKSDPALSNFDPPVPYVPSPVDPPCTVTIDRGVNGKHALFEDEDGWLLILAYNRGAGENKALVNQLVPSSPTKGYSHYWPSDMGLTASDIAEVRFYCHTSNHNRVINFSTKNNWVRTMILNGYMNLDNTAWYWNSGTTKLKGHTGFLPDTATSVYNLQFITDSPVFQDDNLPPGEFAFSPSYNRWGCDDRYAWADTSHQIWIKLA